MSEAPASYTVYIPKTFNTSTTYAERSHTIGHLTELVYILPRNDVAENAIAQLASNFLNYKSRLVDNKKINTSDRFVSSITGQNALYLPNKVAFYPKQIAAEFQEYGPNSISLEINGNGNNTDTAMLLYDHSQDYAYGMQRIANDPSFYNIFNHKHILFIHSDTDLGDKKNADRLNLAFYAARHTHQVVTGLIELLDPSEPLKLESKV